MKKNILWENILFLLIGTALLGFSSIPVWLGKSIETEEIVFRGTYTDTQDYAVHVSMMQAGRLGEWAYQLRFTSEEHSPAFIRLFYIFLGHISRWANLDVETVFQLARWFFGLAALFSIDQLFQKIFVERTTARFAFFLAVLGAGVGWLQLLLGAPIDPIAPIDLWLIDAYILFSISLFPSFSFTLTLMTAALYFFFEFMENGKWSQIFLTCVSALLVQLFNPIAFAVIDLAMVGAVLITWWQARKIEIKHGYALSILAAAQGPLLVYNLLILTRDPIWSQFTSQNETLSPPPIFYLWGFAPFWVFAVYGMIKAIREQNHVIGAMTAWVLGGFALAYLPVLIQRRFLLGITIPLAALALYGLHSLIEQLPTSFQFVKKRVNLVSFTYILFASISSIFLLLNSSLYVLGRPEKLFYPSDLESAVQWLNENSFPNDLVLANIESSQILAQRTQLKVYVGHEMETLFFHNKEAVMKGYFNGIISEQWLEQTSIEWIVYGPYEYEINASFSPTSMLQLAYENNSVKIYQILR